LPFYLARDGATELQCERRRLHECTLPGGAATVIREGEYLGHAEHSNPLRGIRLDMDGCRSGRARCRAELADGTVVGRIFKANAAPVGMSWMWTLTFGHHEDRTPTHGYEATREAGMAAFAKAGGRSDVVQKQVTVPAP
jgi:hypothetical protein